jgi:hypothetical protein
MIDSLLLIQSDNVSRRVSMTVMLTRQESTETQH